MKNGSCLIGYHDTPSGFGSFIRPDFYNIAIPSGLVKLLN